MNAETYLDVRAQRRSPLVAWLVTGALVGLFLALAAIWGA